MVRSVCIFGQNLYTKRCSQLFLARENNQCLRSDLLPLYLKRTLHACEDVAGAVTIACPGPFLLALYE